MISRKSFIQQTMMAATAVAGHSMLSAFESRHRISELSLITGVIEKEMKADWKGTLQQVARIGYKYLEFGNFYGDQREEARRFLKELGLVPLSGGSAMADMKKPERLDQLIDDALFFGKKYLVCYWPWMDNGNNKQLDDFHRASEDLNKLGEACNKRGIRFAFHNHDKEFVPVDGYKWGYEVMLKETDPAAVAMLLDLYWITKGGGDPIQLFKQYPARFEMFHVKDMDKTAEKLYTCPGDGIIDFPAIFAHSKQAGVKYYTVEIDRNDHPMKCIEDSYRYLKGLRF